MNQLLSIDPGSKSAWAFWKRKEFSHDGSWVLVKYGRCKDYDAKMIYDLFTVGDLSQLVWWPDCLVAVEGQWFRLPTMRHGKKVYHSANYDSVVKIIESRCAWIDAAVIKGAKTKIILPSEWIRPMTKGIDESTSNKRIRKAAKLRHPSIKLVGDEHEAVLIGDYIIEAKFV